jgi:hypothetical protein
LGGRIVSLQRGPGTYFQIGENASFSKDVNSEWAGRVE